ncbi:TPA: NACHT domain-containing protein [Vibrio vulnificus]|nr:NACHT domain-containing protein [Vibrio vulnificus]
MRALVSSLCGQKEEVYLEFKSKWYWGSKEKDIRQWGEFLKDFAALVNCTPDHIEDNKYLIIGIDESKEKLDRFVDIDIKQFGFDNIDIFKESVDKKLSFYFEFEDKKNIRDCYRVKQEKFNGRRILYFEINPVSSILMLKKDLQDKKRTEKQGNVFIRRLKTDGEPQVANACPLIIKSMHDKFMEISPEVKKEYSIRRSIDKTIQLFLKKNSALKEVGRTSEKIWKDKVLFEVYNLKSDFYGNVDIIYLFKKSNQIKTREYLISNNLISENSQKFILIDDDSNTDTDGIKSKFSAESVLTISGFARKHLYSDLLSEESFHDGQFKKQRQVKNFIEPSTVGCNDKNAIVLLNEWFAKSSKPLMVVKGYGGVGKTTLVKYFLDQVYLYNRGVENGYRVVFIDSKRIINEISTQGVIDDLFYFYSAHAKVNDFEHRFNQELLELSVDNGNVLIVVDGIDEVIAKLSDRFDVASFIENIFESYLIGNERTKIILTCRDYFWGLNTDEKFNISKLELSPFTESLTKKFFQKEYEINSSEFRKCMEYANEFKFKTGEGNSNDYVYIPYTLDLISDMVRQNREFGEVNRNDIETKILNTNLTDDYFIGRICNREIEKLRNVDVDSQLLTFMKFSVIHRGHIHESNLDKLMAHIDVRDISEISEVFKGHTLISFDHESKTMSFKYDFFKEFFTNLYICYFLTTRDVKLYDDDMIRSISEHIKYNTSFTKRISSRIDFDDNLEIFIMDLIDINIRNLKSKEDILNRQVISGLICVLLSCHNNKNGKSGMEDYTAILSDVFGDNFDYLSILNIFGQDSDKFTLDFRGKKITNSWIENYPFFWECRFNNETSFISGTFKHLEPRKDVSIPLIHSGMFVKCDTAGIHDLIVSSAEHQTQKSNNLVDDIKKIFRLFDTGGTFKEQKVERIEKFANSIVLRALKKKKIITPYSNPKKPSLKQYKVSDEYMDIISVLDQSGSSFELEKIVRMLSE